MPRWSGSKFSGRKAQFFIISTVILAVFLTTISSSLKGYANVDMSQVAQKGEENTFLNAKDQAKNIINSSECPDVERKLDDFRNYVKEELRSNNIDFDMKVSDSCPKPIRISMNLTASGIIIRDEFP